MAHLTQGIPEHGLPSSSTDRRSPQVPQRQARFWHQETPDMAIRRLEQLYLQHGHDIRDADDEVAAKVNMAVQTIFTEDECPGYSKQFPPLDQLESLIELRRAGKEPEEHTTPPFYVSQEANHPVAPLPPFSLFANTSFLDRIEAKSKEEEQPQSKPQGRGGRHAVHNPRQRYDRLRERGYKKGHPQSMCFQHGSHH